MRHTELVAAELRPVRCAAYYDRIRVYGADLLLVLRKVYGQGLDLCRRYPSSDVGVDTVHTRCLLDNTTVADVHTLLSTYLLLLFSSVLFHTCNKRIARVSMVTTYRWTSWWVP